MIKIICLGKLKEKFYVNAVLEYSKRISKYSKIEIIEIPDYPNDDKIISLKKEKEKILSNLKEKDYIITLEIDGQQMKSEDFSNKINNILITNSNIVFIIGSSHGLHDDVKKISNFSLSFSRMTFPHQLFRVMLLEQIYRSYKIINNESYHK
jgi:23S rRNA (pseudouridine1915-N3)-methyltransferase